jgi:hypothetical protein
MLIIARPGHPARNYGRPMRYFLPEWDDLVDPGYRFQENIPTPGRRRYTDEVFAHQLYEQPNCDGLLFSRTAVEGSASKRALASALGIRTYARISRPILGDSGAFSYLFDENPPYQTREMLDYYQALGFDYGVSIDHLILPAFSSVKEQRYQITRENAREFLELHRRGGYSFVPIGVAQGWSPESYRDAVAELLAWGYEYVALGGLARAPTARIIEVLEAVAPVLRAEADLHLFGVARDRGEEMAQFRRLGVTSFDSASPLRQAWLNTTSNYHTLPGKRYSALRVFPVTATHPRVKKLLAAGTSTLADLQESERQALLAVREYDRGRLCLERTLEALLAQEADDPARMALRQPLYRATLIDRPWKYCPCAVCRDLGVEVVVFRGNDRNRRRGFHNTYVFYRRFRELLADPDP